MDPPGKAVISCGLWTKLSFRDIFCQLFIFPIAVRSHKYVDPESNLYCYTLLLALVDLL
jgi:hypothetical protein